MTHLIRIATAADAVALSALARETFADTYAAFNTPQDMNLHLQRSYTPALQAAEIGNVNMLTIVAHSDGALSGFAQLRRSRPPACVSATQTPPRCAWEILRFYLQRDWHGRGLAAPLMEAARQAAVKAGADAIWLSVWSRNVRAQAFYRKCGFEIVGDTTFTLGRDVQHDFVMFRNE
jgi:ribosomal protein S18 acetylase RimI-like enzyme